MKHGEAHAPGAPPGSYAYVYLDTQYALHTIMCTLLIDCL